MKRNVVLSLRKKRLLRDERLTELNRFVCGKERCDHFKEFRFQNPGVLGYGNLVFERRVELLAGPERKRKTWIRDREHGARCVIVHERRGRPWDRV